MISVIGNIEPEYMIIPEMMLLPELENILSFKTLILTAPFINIEDYFYIFFRT